MYIFTWNFNNRIQIFMIFKLKRKDLQSKIIDR